MVSLPEEENVHPLIIDFTLNDKPFWQIYNGEKTVEIRLYDEKRQKLQEGDIIQFNLKGQIDKHIRVKVMSLTRFSSFKELFSSALFDKTGFKGLSIDKFIANMREYYSAENELNFGVLAISFVVLTK